jgi:hypothetical protein
MSANRQHQSLRNDLGDTCLNEFLFGVHVTLMENVDLTRNCIGNIERGEKKITLETLAKNCKSPQMPCARPHLGHLIFVRIDASLNRKIRVPAGLNRQE